MDDGWMFPLACFFIYIWTPFFVWIDRRERGDTYWLRQTDSERIYFDPEWDAEGNLTYVRTRRVSGDLSLLTAKAETLPCCNNPTHGCGSLVVPLVSPLTGTKFVWKGFS